MKKCQETPSRFNHLETINLFLLVYIKSVSSIKMWITNQNVVLHSLHVIRLALFWNALTITVQLGPGQNRNSGWLCKVWEITFSCLWNVTSFTNLKGHLLLFQNLLWRSPENWTPDICLESLDWWLCLTQNLQGLEFHNLAPYTPVLKR